MVEGANVQQPAAEQSGVSATVGDGQQHIQTDRQTDSGGAECQRTLQLNATHQGQHRRACMVGGLATRCPALMQNPVPANNH